MHQRNLFGFCNYVTLLTMICMRLSMRNGIFGFTARKMQLEPKKEGLGDGGKMMMMMICIDEVDSSPVVFHILCKRSRKARGGLLRHLGE